LAEERRKLSDIIFGRATSADRKRYNFFADDYPVTSSSYIQGYNTQAGMFDVNNLGNGASNSAVVACLGVLSRSFSEGRLVVNKYTEDGDQEYVPNHPLEVLLKKPNPYMTGDVLGSYIMTSIHVTGDAYLMKQKNNAGQVIGLHPLIPQYVTPVGNSEQLITGYEYEIKNKKVLFNIEDIIHIRNGIDPDDHKKGFAPLKTVLREIYGDESAGQLGTALLANMGVPSVIISPKDEYMLSEEDADQIQRTYMRKVGGSQKGSPLILSGSMQVETLSFSPKDLDIGTLRNVPESRISAVLGVPAILAGLKIGLDRSTFSNARELRETFTENTLIPLWRQVAQEFENQLLKTDFINSDNLTCTYDLKDIRALQQDTDQVYTRMNSAVQGGWATVADARRAVGLPTSQEDEYYIRSNSLIEVGKDEEVITEQVEEETEEPEQEEQIEEIELASPSLLEVDEKDLQHKIIKVEEEDGKQIYCVYNETETRSFGCYPTRDLAESRLAQIHRFGESQYEDIDIKLDKDEYETIEQARERAEEIGCSGTHTHDKDGKLIYMPCSTHNEYLARTTNVDQRDNGDY
jgi:HK97 family phage portal protein